MIRKAVETVAIHVARINTCNIMSIDLETTLEDLFIDGDYGNELNYDSFFEDIERYFDTGPITMNAKENMKTLQDVVDYCANIMKI